MNKRVFIIHGWGGSPDANWFPWLKTELENKGFNAIAAQMPNADYPNQENWLRYMQELIGKPDESTFLIGHSLGVIAILRYLETLESNRIGGVILVAGFSESLGTIPEIENFFIKEVDYGKVKLSCNKFVVINSDDDPYVPMRKGEVLRDKLDAKFIVIHNAGHLNAGTGYFKLPIALKELIKISQ